MKRRGRHRAYKQRPWIRIYDGDWKCTASSRTIRRGGGRLPTPGELMARVGMKSAAETDVEVVKASFPSGGSGGGSARFGGRLS